MTTETVHAPDLATQVAHRVIRHHAEDAFDPFMIAIATTDEQDETAPVVRACFYYSLRITPKVTILYDNEGRGGMCKMTADEIHFVWRTPELLASLGTTYEAVKANQGDLGEGVPAAPFADLFKAAETKSTAAAE